MSYENLFTIFNTLAFVSWMFLIFAPGWKYTKSLVISGMISLIFAGGYIFLFVSGITDSSSDYTTLAGVRAMFQNDALLLAGWLHYLSFDLFVGTWIVANSRRYSIKHAYIIPALILTFLTGPIGLLTYFIIRYFYKVRFFNHENFGS